MRDRDIPMIDFCSPLSANAERLNSFLRLFSDGSNILLSAEKDSYKVGMEQATFSFAVAELLSKGRMVKNKDNTYNLL